MTAASLGLLVVVLLAGCSRATTSATNIADPPASVLSRPDYTQACAPSGPDLSLPCSQVVLQAIDNARAKEHVPAMRLPSDWGSLSVPEQLFVALDRERVDRGLAPFADLTARLNSVAAEGAAAGRLPRDPGKAYSDTDTEWIGEVSNALDVDYEWMYDDGPGSVPDCSRSGRSGCWADRHVVLDDFGDSATLVMGAAFDATGDTSAGDVGGTSLAAVMAAAASPGTVVYTWDQALQAMKAGVMRPSKGLPANASSTHILDPAVSEPPSPDYTEICAPSGEDNSPACAQAVLQALDHARAAEGVNPMILPGDYGLLTIPEQIFVAVNLERVDRGLAPFEGLTAALDANALKGANAADDPPDPGNGYAVVDTEWAGGSSNGLDAVYGWMYDDGTGSGNLDCPAKGGPGCWGHRHGILDNFGTVGTLVMGAAINPTGDTGEDQGGTSMGATLAITAQGGPAPSFLYTWRQALAAGATPDPVASPTGAAQPPATTSGSS